jgi:hypothetical protein
MVSNTSADAPACAPSPANLLARWRGELNAQDATGAHGGSTVGATSYTPGRHGNAFLFDGASALVTADAADLLWPTGSFSVEAWVKTTSPVTTDVTLLQKYGCGGSDGCDGNDYELLLRVGAHPSFSFRVDGGTNSEIVATLATANDGAWHHLVGVREVVAGKQFLYVDGQLAGQKNIAGLLLGQMGNVDAKPDPLTIGAGRADGVATFRGHTSGAVDEVGVYASAMTEAQVAAIHAAPEGICP